MKEFDLPPDGAEELRALLEHSGAAFQREGNRFRLALPAGAASGRRFATARGAWCWSNGIHSARVAQRERALELCSELNSRVVRGSFFLQEERIVFRTSAQLTERFEARERIARRAGI